MIIALFVSFAQSRAKRGGGHFPNWGKTPVPRPTWPTPAPPWPDSTPPQSSSARRMALFMVLAFATGTAIIWMAQQPSRWPRMSDEISLMATHVEPRETRDASSSSLS
jgi:hypothetical protein